MDILLILLIVLLLFGAPLGWSYAGPAFGGGLGIVLIVVILILIMYKRL